MPLLLFNKPFGVICQFSGDGSHPTLAKFIRVPEVYPAGRLDTDSEGLLLLTDDGILQARISDPRSKLPKHYWAQVEGVPDRAALQALERGVDLGDYVTRPAQARLIDEPPELWPRNPPIRHRAAIPTSWIELVITEGKNRQVRRMTAQVGFPTLRLIRHRIGTWSIQGLAPGEWIEGQTPAIMRKPQDKTADARPTAPRKPQGKPSGPRSAAPRQPQERTAGSRSSASRTPQDKTADSRSAAPRTPRDKADGSRSTAPRTPQARTTAPRSAAPRKPQDKTAGPRPAAARKPQNKTAGSRSAAPRKPQVSPRASPLRRPKP